MKKVFFLLLPLFFVAIITSAQTVTFNGVANNSTDNTAALNAAFQQGSTVNIPAGSNYYKIAGTVNIPAGKTIVFASGAKFNVTGRLSGNNTTINAGETEIFKNTSIISGTWTTNYMYAIWTGAVGNGSTDDYASLDLFFELMDITTYTQARLGINKQYYIRDFINQNVNSEINLDGRGSRIFRKYTDLSQQETIITLSGVAANDSKTITSNLIGGQRTMTVNSASGLTPGMGFILNSTETYAKEDYGGGVWQIHKKAIMSKIVSINGNTITMADTIPFNMHKDSLESSALKFYNVSPITIKNLNFGSENITGSNTMIQLRINRLFDVTIENIICSPLGYSGLSAARIYNGYFNNISCISPSSGGDDYKFGVYGILASLNVNCTYNNIYGRAMTHGIAFSAFTDGPSNKVIVSNSDFKANNSISRAVDSHASAWVEFSNCTVWGAQAVIGTLIFDNCEMYEPVNGTTIFNEREGGSRGGLKVYITNSNFYTKSNGSTNSTLFLRQDTDNAETNRYSIRNNTFYLENAQTYITNGNAATATSFQPFIVDGNEFYGSGTLFLGRYWDPTTIAQDGTFTFKNNLYSKINFHSPPADQFATIEILNNTPVSTSTSDFWVNWDGYPGNVSFINNVFVGTCFWIKGCSGNIEFNNNNIYNNVPNPAVSYKNRNYITGNSLLAFTSNNLYSTYWTLTGNQLVSGNISNGVAQPIQTSGSWGNINTPGSIIETGITMAGVQNFTIISRAKMTNLTTNAVQYLTGSSIEKLYLGFNPNEAAPAFKGSIKNVNGNIVRPNLYNFYMDSQWHTYAFVMENGVLKGYMDGIAMLSYDASSTYTQMYASGTIQIGGTNSTNLWSGPIQSFAIYNRKLSLSEIKSFSENPNVSISGELYKSANYTDEPPSNSGDLISHWALDENSGTTAVDSSGNNYNGTLINGPLWTSGFKGNSLQFDGVNDRVNCGTSTGLDMGTGDFTVASWVKMNSSQVSFPTLIGKGATSSTTAGYWLYITSTNIKFVLGDGVSRMGYTSNAVSLYDNNWHHIAVTVDRDGNAVFYKDGVNVGSVNVSAYNGKNITTPSIPLNIGSASTSSATFFKGNIDDVNLFNTTLSQAEIASLAEITPQNNDDPDLVSYWALNETAGTTAADGSGNNYNGMLINGPQWTTGQIGNSLQFDGVNDRVDCGTSTGLDMGTGDFTVASWVKMSSSQVSFPTLVCKGATSSSSAGYWLYITSTNIKFVLGDGVSRMGYTSNAVSLYDNNWHHIAVTVDRDGNAIFYKDGVNVGSVNVSGFNGKNIVNSTHSLTIGSALDYSSTLLTGKLDEVKIYKRALSPSEVSNLMGVPQNNSILLGTGEENQDFHFINAFPNPFRDKLTLRISSTKDQKVNAYIYDMNGIAIKKYDNKSLTVGVNELYWDGRNDNGAFVNPGMYFVRVITNSEVDNLTIIKIQ